jgi:hypothetical protein
MLSRFLNWRARHVAVRAEDAATASLGFQEQAAALALVKKLAGVYWHCLG